MIIQELTISFADQKAPKLTSRYGEEGRQYLFTPDQEIPEGASVVLQIVKPDRNFVIDNAAITEDKILVTIPQQATVAKGIAYYNIEVQKSGLLIYSAEGEIWVDDALIDDSMIESISEVFGYKFPDDFITDDKIVPLIINDAATGTTTTWSSSFIQEKISEIQPGSTVVVNPTDSATATAEKIKVDGTTYDFPAYSDVEVNPSDAASSTMEKIKVDGTTYDLPTYPESLAELDDTSIVTPAEGDLLTYDSLTGKWINDAPPAVPDLDDLGDVDITTPTEGDILQYDDTDETWKNTQLPPIPPVSTTVTGNPIELTDAASAPMVKCVTDIQGSQDLHGYDKPWVGGAGKNKCNGNFLQGYWAGSDGSFVSSNTYISTDKIVCKPNTYYTISADATYKVGNQGVCWYDSNGDYISFNEHRTSAGAYVNWTFQSPEGAKYMAYDLQKNPNESTISPSDITHIQIEEGQTATAFAPYSNICPITAYTEGEIEVRDGDGNTTTHTTTYPSAIYRGSEDVVNGTATTEWGMIDSYAGETLPGEWISDRDEYAPGTTPTTGAQVAYALATPTTSSVTPTNLPIRTLSGYNHIESSTGEMEVEYINQRYQPLLDAAAIMIGNNVTTLRTTPAPVQSIQREDLQPISLEEKVKESAELADLTEEEEEENDYED